ncbi:hypothetical protein [Helicobacter sp. MIT 14-3879]|nr:hypothetical protein [Helicobacter sp. MIT 14-3879]
MDRYLTKSLSLLRILKAEISYIMLQNVLKILKAKILCEMKAIEK